MWDQRIQDLIEKLQIGSTQGEALRRLVLQAAAMPPSQMRTYTEEMQVQLRGPVSEINAGAGDAYEDRGLIGAGSFAEVRRTYDSDLNREVAMKVLSSANSKQANAIHRFVGEARVGAQLSHPNIVPVHELGLLNDGRYYFTMKVVQGTTLTTAIRRVHDVSLSGEWTVTDDGWSFHRLVSAFHLAVDAIAYAHGRGVIHRDLKPENIMVGAYSQVFVMDWGLAKVLNSEVQEPVEAGEVPTLGGVSGTPAYMSPEQAAGTAIDARSDVYGLGATLYHILAGRPPYLGSASDVIVAVRTREPTPLSEVFSDPEGAPSAPLELVEICEKAMARDPAHRFCDARQLADAVEAWIHGSKNQHRASLIVERGSLRLASAESRMAEAKRVAQQTQRALDLTERWAKESLKSPLWQQLDESEQQIQKAAEDIEGAVFEIRSALSLKPDLREAHEALARRLRFEHLHYQANQQEHQAIKALALMKLHVQMLPDGVTKRRYMSYIRGEGFFTLTTEPEGATIELRQMVHRRRRLPEKVLGAIGPTPVRNEVLSAGSYVATVHLPEHAEVILPFVVPRRSEVDFVAPKAHRASPLVLPKRGEINVDSEAFVCPGWFVAGGEGSGAVGRHRLWCDGFVMQRYPVTIGEYLEFLHDLIDQGHAEEAEQWAPRLEQGSTPAFARSDEGRYDLTYKTASGEHQWDPSWPMVLVTWESAWAYADWWSEKTGHSWRLPSEWEWEKAARGADGREYPWGDFSDATWFNNKDAWEKRAFLADVRAFATDVSPYGIRGCAGGVHEWCLERAGVGMPVEGSRVLVDSLDLDTTVERVVRGGAWNLGMRRGRCACRRTALASGRFATTGFRLVRSWPEVPEREATTMTLPTCD